VGTCPIQAGKRDHSVPLQNPLLAARLLCSRFINYDVRLSTSAGWHTAHNPLSQLRPHLPAGSTQPWGPLNPTLRATLPTSTRTRSELPRKQEAFPRRRAGGLAPSNRTNKKGKPFSPATLDEARPRTNSAPGHTPSVTLSARISSKATDGWNEAHKANRGEVPARPPKRTGVPEPEQD